jgi:hypothetical protein
MAAWLLAVSTLMYGIDARTSLVVDGEAEQPREADDHESDTVARQGLVSSGVLG